MNRHAVHHWALALLALLAFFQSSSQVAFAEKIESAEDADVVLVGTVEKVDEHWRLGFDMLGTYFFQEYEADIEVESQTKGETVPVGQTVLVFYWRKTWLPIGLSVIVIIALLLCIWSRRIQSAWLRWTVRGVVLVVGLFTAGSSLPMPGMYGHHDFPQPGERRQFYLKSTSGGGFVGLYPRWAAEEGESVP